MAISVVVGLGADVPAVEGAVGGAFARAMKRQEGAPIPMQREAMLLRLPV